MASIYSLDEVAARFGWTRRKLIWRLKRYGISIHGAGGDATVSETEVEQLLRAEAAGRSPYATARAIRARTREEKKKSG